jgi:hypothetical protein
MFTVADFSIRNKERFEPCRPSRSWTNRIPEEFFE